ncbi:VanZ like family protein [compost metagenome]
MVCILLSFVLSLLFEVTQITGIYGLFDNPYRIFDVDDLITNTLGGIAGFRIALRISGLLPRIEQLDRPEDLSTKRVTYTRRGIAFMLDACVWLTAAGVLSLFPVSGPLWIVFAVYFLLIPCWTGGRTFGKWMVRIRVQGYSSSLRLWMIVLRYGLLYGVTLGMNILLFNYSWIGTLGPGITDTAHGIVLLGDLLFLIHLIISMFKKEPLFYERLSQTQNVITWPQKQRQADTVKMPESIER